MMARNLVIAGLLLLALGSGGLLAQQSEAGAMQLSQGLAAPQPDLLRPGQCVRYQEGGAGFMGREPMFWLEGTVESSRHEQQQVKPCPREWQTERFPSDREAFLQREKQTPCHMQEQLSASTEMAWVKLRVKNWETPWAKSWAAKGRLYRGMYMDHTLAPGLELEINARLLRACQGS